MIRRILATTLIATGLPAAAYAGNGDALLPFIPGETTMLVGFDGVALRNSATFQRFYGLINDAEVASDTLHTLRELGVDPASMIESLAYAAVSLDENEDHVAMLIEFSEEVDGSLLDARLAEWATEIEEFLGSSCYSHDAGYTVARISDHVMIAAPLATVQAAITRAADAEGDDSGELVATGPSEALAGLVARVDRTGLLWLAIVVPEGTDDPWLAPVRSLTATLNVGTTVDMALSLTGADAVTAAAQADELRAGAARLAGAAEVRALGLDGVLSSVVVDTQDTETTVVVSVDEETWSGLLETAYAVVESELQ